VIVSVELTLAGLMRIESGWDAVAEPDATWAVNGKVPACVGVPVMTPVEAINDNPGGSVPPKKDQRKGIAPPAAASDALYGVPTVPAGRLVVVIVSVEVGSVVEIVTTKVADDVVDESATSTLKELVPATVGVPEITPVEEFKLRPLGKFPKRTVHVYGGLPPVAVKFAWYGTPTVPLGKLAVVIWSGGPAAAMTMERVWVAVVPPAETWTVNVLVPAMEGVPEIVPAFRVRLAGRKPERIDQTYGGVPPVALRVAL